MSARRRQIMGSSFPHPVTPAAALGETAEVQQFLSRITTPDATHLSAYRALINGLVTAGVWSLIDGLYIMAAADSTTAKVNLKQTSYGLTQVGTVNFSANFGCYSDGTTGYFDTGYTPSTSGGNFSTAGGDGGTLAVYIQSIDTNATLIYEIRSHGSTTDSQIAVRGSTGSFQALIGGAGNVRTTPSTQGSFLISRTSHTADFVYRNESQLGITGNQVAFSIPDATIKIFGSVSPFSTRVNSAVMFGDTLTTTQAGAYQALVNAYMAVFGVSVY